MVDPAAGSDPWDVLGLPRGAGREEVERAWRALAARHHPDVGGDARAFRALSTAREQLLGAGRRGPAPVLHRSGPVRDALRPLRRRIDRRRRPRVT